MSSVMPCPQDPCGELLAEILEFMANLLKRYWDLRNNVGDLPMTPPATPDPRYGTRSIQGERQQFRGRQQGLRNRLNEYSENGCGPPPVDAWEWATREVPEADARPSDGQGVRRATEVGVGLAGAALAGYIAYRVIRMIPSVAIPPLWPTIPINAAVP